MYIIATLLSNFLSYVSHVALQEVVQLHMAIFVMTWQANFNVKLAEISL